MQAYFAQLPTEKSLKLEAFLKQFPFETILDYRNFSQDPRFFQNEDHLNEYGARQLLRQIEKNTGLALMMMRYPPPARGAGIPPTYLFFA